MWRVLKLATQLLLPQGGVGFGLNPCLQLLADRGLCHNQAWLHVNAHDAKYRKVANSATLLYFQMQILICVGQ